MLYLKKSIFLFSILLLLFINLVNAATINVPGPGCPSISSGNTYLITGTISGNCFSLSSVNNVIIDGQGNTYNPSGTAFSVSGSATDIVFKNFIVSSGSVSISKNNARARVSVINNNFQNGGLATAGAHDVYIADNKFNGNGQIRLEYVEDSLWHAFNITFFNNSVILSQGIPDLYHIFEIDGIERSNISNNYIRTAASNPGLVVKAFELNASFIANNKVIFPNVATSMGVQKAWHLRSASRDNYFYNNSFISFGQGAAYGMTSYDDNQCCSIDGQFPPPGQCGVGEYIHGCYNRRNVYDSNTFYGDTAYEIWNGDGLDSIYKNNLFIGDTAFNIQGCATGSPQFYNNVFHGINGLAMATGSCTIIARNNIFYRTSGTVFSGTFSSSNYNLFYSAYSSGQANSISGQNPNFINPAGNSFDVNYNLLGNYRLQPTSPAIDAGDPTVQVSKDRDGFSRPQGVRQDIGAYEYGAVIANCYDSDSGNYPTINQDVIGTVYLEGVSTSTDSCSGSTLTEYYCAASTSTSVSSTSITCTYGCSNGICNAAPDTTAPVISNIQSSGITSSSATITWTTDETSTSEVRYGTSSGSYTLTATGSSAISHSVTLSGLNPSTTYYYVVRSTDSSNNIAQSSESTFSTSILTTNCGASCSGCTNNNILATACTTPGRLCDGQNSIEDIRLSSSSINFGSQLTVFIDYACTLGAQDNLALWYYNGNSWSLIQHWPAPLTGCDTSSDGADGTVSTAFTPSSISGIHYVRAIEADPTDTSSSSCPAITWGNIDDMAFNVESSGGDTTAPIISNIRVVNITNSSVTINWTTDELSSSIINYGLTTSYGSQATGNNGAIEHSVTINSLQSNTLYYYVVRSTDSSNNIGQSSQGTFTTLQTTQLCIINCVNYTLNLSAGLNFVSIPIIPENSNINVMFQTILVNISKIFYYNNTLSNWQIYNTNTAIPSNLNSLENQKGYFILMNNASNITIIGSATYEDGSSPVKQIGSGWNSLGLFGLTPRTLAEELQGITYLSAWKFNNTNKSYYEISSVDTIRPGEAYWVYIN